jgi:BirA family biotin operon repressor/biotin-[acetyl-CoA-carboxylase] ligase
MALKDKILDMLALDSIAYISGEYMAECHGVSRAAVWKAIRQLQQEGFSIDAQRNKGYRLIETYDPLSEEGIVECLPDRIKDIVKLHIEDSTGSTNDDARDLATSGAPEFTVVGAREQVKGRGRRGRPFYALGDTGVYLSILLRPTWNMEQAMKLTAAAAVAVSRAVEAVSPAHASIKWVNDVYIGPKKICGILTEASADLETGGLSYAIVGIGVNVYEPKGGFPADVAQRAGAVFKQVQQNGRNRIAAGIISELINIYAAADFKEFIPEYRERSFLPGKDITVLEGSSQTEKHATAISIEDDLSLRVRYENGIEENLQSGEVSIRISAQK